MSLSEKKVKWSKITTNAYRETDVKECFQNIEARMLKKFGMSAGMVIIKIIREEAGRGLT